MLASLIAAPSLLPLPIRLGILALALGVLLWISLAPNEDLPGADLIWDKASHAIAYVVLMGVGFFLFPRRSWLFVGIALVLGAAIEVAQASMDFGRQGDWRDMLADALGIAFGFLLWRLLLVGLRR